VTVVSGPVVVVVGAEVVVVVGTVVGAVVVGAVVVVVVGVASPPHAAATRASVSRRTEIRGSGVIASRTVVKVWTCEFTHRSRTELQFAGIGAVRESAGWIHEGSATTGPPP
jgi:hypothetical protein